MITLECGVRTRTAHRIARSFAVDSVFLFLIRVCMSVWEAKLISSRICPSHLASAVAFFQSQMKVETEKRRPPQPWPIVKTKAVPNPNSGSTISAALPTSVNTDSRVGWRWQDSHGESGSAVRSSPPPPRPAPARRGPRPAQSNDLSFEFIVCYAHTYTWPPSSLPPSHSAFASPASLAIATDDSSSLLSFLASLPPSPLPSHFPSQSVILT